jgi:site-specific DNA recombinase
MRYFAYCRKSTESSDRQVLSIESQRAELARAFGAVPGITIVEWFDESMSAKTPGRPIFSALLDRIEKGHADGIVAWHPDRLARNSIDGGRIIYLLDQGRLKDLKFATFSFENNPQGKLMLSVLLGFSKYYVDSLSENVKRGNRAKAERGWRPGAFPLGYRNDPVTKTVVVDPEHFAFVRRLFGLALTGVYPVSQLLRIATDDWGYRLPNDRRHKGRVLARSTLYKILSNPFYTGQFAWNGQFYPGKHDAVISIAEFARLQAIVRRKHKERPQRHTFPFTGLIRCGGCGLGITAEHQVNRYGSHYDYYHCTRRDRQTICRQPAIPGAELERQLVAMIGQLSLDEGTLRLLAGSAASDRALQGLFVSTVQDETTNRQRGINEQLSTLTDLRLRGVIEDDEYLSKRRDLVFERAGLTERQGKVAKFDLWFELGAELQSFRRRAISWFTAGTHQTKRMILQTVGSNFRLTDKKLSYEARKPFTLRAEEPSSLLKWAGDDDVRTLFERLDPSLLDLLQPLREIRTMAEKEAHMNPYPPMEDDERGITMDGVAA